MNARYRTLSSWLKQQFGEPVRKITIDAGLGCPNRDGTLGTQGCLYCNQRGSGTGATMQGIGIADQVARGIESLASRYKCKKFIAYFQSYTNTYGDLPLLKRLYGEALQRPEIVGLAIGTRPDCVPESVLDILEEVAEDHLVWIEYGLQSSHQKTLNLINRGHGPEVFFDATNRTQSRGIPVVAHMILGLPGESMEDMLKTARLLGEAHVDGVKLHPLYVIKNTGLDQMYRNGLYKPLTEEQALELTITILEIFPPDMVIHRLTSDPHPEELVAPNWMLDRRGVHNRLQEALEERDIRQGSKFTHTTSTSAILKNARAVDS